MAAREHFEILHSCCPVRCARSRKPKRTCKCTRGFVHSASKTTAALGSFLSIAQPLSRNARGTLQHQPLQGEEHGHHAGRGRPGAGNFGNQPVALRGLHMLRWAMPPTKALAPEQERLMFSSSSGAAKPSSGKRCKVGCRMHHDFKGGLCPGVWFRVWGFCAELILPLWLA